VLDIYQVDMCWTFINADMFWMFISVDMSWNSDISSFDPWHSLKDRQLLRHLNYRQLTYSLQSRLLLRHLIFRQLTWHPIFRQLTWHLIFRQLTWHLNFRQLTWHLNIDSSSDISTVDPWWHLLFNLDCYSDISTFDPWHSSQGSILNNKFVSLTIHTISCVLSRFKTLERRCQVSTIEISE